MNSYSISAEIIVDLFKEISRTLNKLSKMKKMNMVEQGDLTILHSRIDRIINAHERGNKAIMFVIQQKDIEGLKTKPDEASVMVIDTVKLNEILNFEKNNLLELSKQKALEALELLDHTENIDKTDSYLIAKVLKEKAEMITEIQNKMTSAVITHYILK